MRLTIELVPETSWYANVRSNVSAAAWNKIKSFCAKRAGNKCEICGGVGPKWPVECHEIWQFDDLTKTQKLIGLQSLCPNCHAVKHIGRTQAVGNFDVALKHLIKVNEWDKNTATRYIEQQFEIWRERSTTSWVLDINYLDTLGV